jgi:hypothetical protein
MSDRKLIFAGDGTGCFNVQGEPMPYFKWWLNGDGCLGWQFFLDASFGETCSSAHAPEYFLSEDGNELSFVRAPFPFGIRHFRRDSIE